MLYVVRLGGADRTDLAFCSPCSACHAQIKKFGVRKIVHVNRDGELTHSRVRDLDGTHVSLGNQVLGKT